MRDRSDASHAWQRLLRVACIGGFLFMLVLAGCGGTRPAPPSEPPGTTAPQEEAATVAPVVPAPAQPSAPPLSPLPSTLATPSAAEAVEPERPAAPSTPAPASQSATKAAAPAAKASPKAAAPPAPAAQPPKKEAVAAEAAKPKAEPPLDLTSLETRLKDTKAIGVMTKLALKNQVDDLLDQFRAFYQGKLKTTLAELRRRFDLLILKVLSLLQDSDPSLASAIAASREAIWAILADPVKFADFASN